MRSAILLDDPKYPHNVGGAYRAAACFGAEEVMVTGRRVPLEPSDGYRLPREERMRYWRDEVRLRHVDLLRGEWAPVGPDSLVPVVVEVSGTAEQLHHFVHPENAVYIFGPEDGSVSRYFREAAHRFLVIPSFYCLNLAGAVYVTLYDRVAKAKLAGKVPELASGELMGGAAREGWA
jgi:tRNA(Leu) C34 or U34 (ribose-2'-O)-methylase TrmL